MRGQAADRQSGAAWFVRFQLSLTSISGLPLSDVTHSIPMGSLQKTLEEIIIERLFVEMTLLPSELHFSP